MSTVAESAATVQAHHLLFPEALAMAEAQALTKLDPSLHERLSAAMWLVQQGHLLQRDDGSWDVTSQTTPGQTYHINGHGCSCPDAQYRAKDGHCKHFLSVCLMRRSLQLMHESHAPIVPLAAHDTATDEPQKSTAVAHSIPDEPVNVDPRFITHLHGKPFIRYAGLLAMAHAAGLVSLKVRFISVTAELALAEAEATFANGHTYSECADSTPLNVPPHIKPHFPRMAATRAKARALRDALNIGICSLEEAEA
jgi:hypothetical protein